MGIFGPPNVEKMKARGYVQGLIEALSHRKAAEVRAAAARALGEMSANRRLALRTPAAEALIGAIEDSDAAVRKAVAVALGSIVNQIFEPLLFVRIIEAFIDALKDRDSLVRFYAIDGLGKNKKRMDVPLQTRVEGLIIAVLKDPDITCREAAASTLDKFGWLPGQDEDSVIYWMIKRGWEKVIEIGAPAVEPLIAGLNNANWKISEQAIRALGQIGGTRVVPALIPMLSDNNVGKITVETLVKIGPPSVKPLIASLKDLDWKGRNKAIAVLGQSGDQQAVEPLMAILSEMASNNQDAPANTLNQIGNPRPVGALISARKENAVDLRSAPAEVPVPALADRNASTRNAVVSALGQLSNQIGDPVLLARINEAFMASLQDSDNFVRKYAIVWLGKNKNRMDTALQTRVVELIIAAINDRDIFCREAAAVALGCFGEACAVEPLVLSLEDRDERVRRAASAALRNIGKPAVQALIPLLSAVNRDLKAVAANTLKEIGWLPGLDMNSAAYWVIFRKWEKCIEIGAPAIEPLIGALGDGNWQVRKDAAGTLVRIHNSGRLDDADKNRILLQRDRMSTAHQDRNEWVSNGSSSDCTGNTVHTDNNGIGVSFSV